MVWCCVGWGHGWCGVRWDPGWYRVGSQVVWCRVGPCGVGHSIVTQMMGCRGTGGSQMVQCDDGMACRWCGVGVDGITGGVGLPMVWCWAGWGHRWCGWVGLQVVGCGSGWGPGWCWVDKSGVVLLAEGKQLFMKSTQFSFLGIS